VDLKENSKYNWVDELTANEVVVQKV